MPELWQHSHGWRPHADLLRQYATHRLARQHRSMSLPSCVTVNGKPGDEPYRANDEPRADGGAKPRHRTDSGGRERAIDDGRSRDS